MDAPDLSDHPDAQEAYSDAYRLAARIFSESSSKQAGNGEDARRELGRFKARLGQRPGDAVALARLRIAAELGEADGLAGAEMKWGNWPRKMWGE